MNFTLNEILFGVGHGRPQSVGNMEVIPLIDEEGSRGESWNPPTNLEMGTSSYGTVYLWNSGDGPTIVPLGSSWVVKEKAQDHAIGSAIIIDKGQGVSTNTAMCIQSTQGGKITQGNHDFTILPLDLRWKALALRSVSQYDKLWQHIRKFDSGYGMDRQDAALINFLTSFKRQLDQFVAEFELVPRQIGAIIRINGVLVGIELAPSEEFWKSLWVPLIRVCYGSLAIKAASGVSIPNRLPLVIQGKDLNSIRDAMIDCDQRTEENTRNFMSYVESKALAIGSCDQEALDHKLLTVATDNESGSENRDTLSGQIVMSEEATVSYLSLGISLTE